MIQEGTVNSKVYRELSREGESRIQHRRHVLVNAKKDIDSFRADSISRISHKIYNAITKKLASWSSAELVGIMLDHHDAHPAYAICQLVDGRRHLYVMVSLANVKPDNER